MIMTKTDFTDQRYSYHHPHHGLLERIRGQRLGMRELSLVNMGVI